jgi:hypothetical protein
VNGARCVDRVHVLFVEVEDQGQLVLACFNRDSKYPLNILNTKSAVIPTLLS